MGFSSKIAMLPTLNKFCICGIHFWHGCHMLMELIESRPSIIKSFDRSTSWDSTLKGRGIWNAWMVECNYKISLHTFELFCDADVQCNTTNSNSQGKQKIGEVKCSLCPVNKSFKESFYLSCTIDSHCFTFRLFYKSLFTSHI